ncbi:MAG: type II secretion system protein [Planctomycetota bacterium]|nr:type II secretion system protein [Planctomycetota bacterium]
MKEQATTWHDLQIPRRSRIGFTLIEILIVVTILGIVSALVVPQFAEATGETATTSTTRQLQVIRSQVELFRNQNNRNPDFQGQQWDELITNDYLTAAPRNLLNGSTTIADAPALDVGWVWRDKGNGTYVLYATDETFLSEFGE